MQTSSLSPAAEVNDKLNGIAFARAFLQGRPAIIEKASGPYFGAHEEAKRSTRCRIIQCTARAEYFAEGDEELRYCAGHVPEVMLNLRTTVQRNAEARPLPSLNAVMGEARNQPGRSHGSSGGGRWVEATGTGSGDAGWPLPSLHSVIEEVWNQPGERHGSGGGKGRAEVREGSTVRSLVATVRVNDRGLSVLISRSFFSNGAHVARWQRKTEGK